MAEERTRKYYTNDPNIPWKPGDVFALAKINKLLKMEEEVKNNAEYNDLKKEVILNAIKKEYNKCDKRLRMIGQRWMLVGSL